MTNSEGIQDWVQKSLSYWVQIKIIFDHIKFLNSYTGFEPKLVGSTEPITYNVHLPLKISIFFFFLFPSITFLLKNLRFPTDYYK